VSRWFRAISREFWVHTAVTVQTFVLDDLLVIVPAAWSCPPAHAHAVNVADTPVGTFFGW
jgi:hypothetical protein